MEQFIHRLKSFAWRLGAYLAVAGLVWIADNIGLLDLPPYLATIIALVIGEITKFLNKTK